MPAARSPVEPASTRRSVVPPLTITFTIDQRAMILIAVACAYPHHCDAEGEATFHVWNSSNIMADILSIGIIDEERRGWSLPCPACGEAVPYTIIHIRGGNEPFMHCDSCSSFVLRSEDMDRLQRYAAGAQLTVDQLRYFYEEMEYLLPRCPCGGCFRTWANVKCPKCRYKFLYNQGEYSEDIRFHQATIVWIESAVAYRGGKAPSNRLRAVDVV